VGEHARVRVADEALARVVAGDPAGAGRAVHLVVRLHLAEPLLEAVQEALAEHRPVQHRRVGRVADDGGLDPGEELLQEGVVDVVVDDRDAERGAALAGGAEAGEQRALGGEVQVGVRHHDERVLAAQLEAGVLQVPAGQLADLRPDGARAGEADLVTSPSSSAARGRRRSPRPRPAPR
jgi:hypothetical protein